jgi:hypothetical protein
MSWCAMTSPSDSGRYFSTHGLVICAADSGPPNAGPLGFDKPSSTSITSSLAILSLFHNLSRRLPVRFRRVSPERGAREKSREMREGSANGSKENGSREF